MNDIFEKLFYQALRIRYVEEKIIELYPRDLVQSPVHLSIGQEPVAVAVCNPLNNKDLIFSNYRGHAYYLAKGGDLKLMMAELFGRSTGMAYGKAGSMHLLAKEVGFTLASAVVASTIPHAVGSALATKIQSQDHLNICVFGDGAMEEGVFHESLNLAKLLKAPVLFLCENNGLAVHASVEDRQSFKIKELVNSYGINYTQIEDGFDFINISETVKNLKEEILEYQEPRFLEINTYRYREHVGPGDDFDAGYRSPQLLQQWTKKDPLIQRTDLVKKFRPQILSEIEEAIKFAESSPFPGQSELLTHVL